MDKAEFMEGIHLLQDNYNKTLTGNQLKLFYDNLKDMEKETYIQNIKSIIKTSPYMPNIAEIRFIKNKNYTNYEQRQYENIDFNKFYANKGG